LTDHGDWSSLAAELIEEIGDVSEDYVLVIHENIAQVLDGVFFFMQVWMVLETRGLMPYWVLRAWSRHRSIGVVSKGTLTFTHSLDSNHSSVQ
jgi:hypothetical protein